MSSGSSALPAEHKPARARKRPSLLNRLYALLLAVAVTGLTWAAVADPKADLPDGIRPLPFSVWAGTIVILTFAPQLYAWQIRTRVRAIVSTVLVLGILVGSLGYVGAVNTPGMELADAARALFREVSVASDALVFGYREAYVPRTTLAIRPHVGDPIERRTTDFTYVFVIDDAPATKFAHPVRYVLIPETGSVEVIDAEWLPTVNGRPWKFDSEITVDGRAVVALRDAESAAVGPAGNGTEVRSASARPGQLRPAVVPASAEGKKVAIVVDGSDRRGEWMIWLEEQRNIYEQMRRHMFDESAVMADYLRQIGFDTRVLSSSGTTGVGLARPAPVLQEIARAAKDAGKGGEIVLYLNAHGNVDGIQLFADSGRHDALRYDVLRKWIAETVDPSINMTIVIDACQSGAALGELRRPNTQIITATDAKHAAPGGLGASMDLSETILAARSTPEADLDGNKVVDLIEAAKWASAREQFRALGAKVDVVPPVVAAAPPQPVAPPATQPQPPAQPQVAPPSQTLAPVQLQPAGSGLLFAGALLPPPFAVAEEEYSYALCYPEPESATALCGVPQATDPSGGSPPYHFQLGSGTGFPPQGIRLDLNGRLMGRPSAATAGRTYPFEACAIDLRAASVCRLVSLRVIEQLRLAITAVNCVIDLSVTGAPYYSRITVTGTASGPSGVEFRPPFQATLSGTGRGWSCAPWTVVGGVSCERRDGSPSSIAWSASYVVFRADQRPGQTYPVEASVDWSRDRSIAVASTAFRKDVSVRATCP